MTEKIIEKTPQHWLINISPTIGWYLKEGIWIHKQLGPALRVIAVYLGLTEIPEALAELEECYQGVMTKFAPNLLKWIAHQKAIVLTKGTLKALKLNTAPINRYDINSLCDIFTPWVKRWAIGSKPMLQWVIAVSVLKAISQPLGLNRAQLRKANGKAADNLVDFAMQFAPELAWAWKLLLSGEYNRLEATKRELARRTVQDMRYYHMEERALLIHARYWIMVYVLGYLEKDVLEIIDQDLKSGPSTQDFSSKILSPINQALEYHPRKGRPHWKKSRSEEIFKQIQAILRHSDF